MESIKIDGRMKVETLKSLFKETFGGTLRVYKDEKGHLADDSSLLCDLRNEGVPAVGTFSCRASITVAGFCRRMLENFGIIVKVATIDNWVLVLDDITLANVSKIKKQATREDMEQYRSKYASKSTKGQSGKTSKFEVYIYTKGAHEFGIAPLPENEDIESLTEERINLLRGEHRLKVDYITDQAFCEEFEDEFCVYATDYEEGDYVYNEDQEESDFGAFYGCWKKVVLENGEVDYEDDEDLENLASKISESQPQISAGKYILIDRIEKRRTQGFLIEDDEFHPEKLRILPYTSLNGLLGEENWSDMYAVTYDKQLLEIEFQDGCAYWGELIYIVEKKADGSWETIREIY